VCILTVLPSLGATFGTVVPHTLPVADLVLDEARKRVYLVNTYENQVDVYSTATNPPSSSTSVKTSATPLAIAMSRSGKFLYVACYDASTLDIIDLTSASFSKTSVTLAAKPEGVQRKGPYQHHRNRNGAGRAHHLRSLGVRLERLAGHRGGAARAHHAPTAAAQRPHVFRQ
jgi:DNA-binding beta-propeller fold protein YncE